VIRTLKFGTFVAINFVIAVIGTAILDHGLWKAIPPPSHTVAGVMWKESLLSVVCAAGLGFSIRRFWHNSSTMYTWVPAMVLFVIGLIATAGHSDVLGRVFPFGSGADLGPAEIRSFFAFTVPLIRSISYSVGSYLSSLLRASPEASRS
jgi:hypothetical protein